MLDARCFRLDDEDDWYCTTSNIVLAGNRAMCIQIRMSCIFFLSKCQVGLRPGAGSGNGCRYRLRPGATRGAGRRCEDARRAKRRRVHVGRRGAERVTGRREGRRPEACGGTGRWDRRQPGTRRGAGRRRGAARRAERQNVRMGQRGAEQGTGRQDGGRDRRRLGVCRGTGRWDIVGRRMG